MPDRRFPPPWYFEDIGTCFVVKDQGGRRSRLSITIRDWDADPQLIL